ncbi:TetR/AcrR family transcriptional regulator [Pantoea sp. GM01]|uniref:TetR/AcrR family transcriptional regulator n=1 Tax=Pantoea sp. GM01 TaxID=1144320 RepID=UPI000270F0CE|nr:TetR/AcrR family transcriptional regulator [Pantoea sp. GM01]EJL91542.1 transcriptional regulator [Pantoea sp. GM01]
MTERKKTGRPKLFSEQKLAELMFQVFSRKGYASTGIADLTQATGLKPASLYLAFGNKEGMYAAALAHYKETWLCELESVLNNPDSTFEVRIRRFLSAAFTVFSHGDKHPGCIMTFSALAFNNDDGELARHLRDQRMAFRQWLESEAEQARERGELPGIFTPAEFACFIITFEQGLALSALDKPDPGCVQAMIDKLVTLLFSRS